MLVPFTASSEAYVSNPAIFSAMHLIRPRCPFSTDAIFKTLDLADNLLIAMPFSPEIIGSLLSVHLIWMGRSPLTIMQETPVLSPVLNESSPNVNGIICGGTVVETISESELISLKLLLRLVDLARIFLKPSNRLV